MHKSNFLILCGVYLIVLLFATVYFTVKLIEKSAVVSFKKLYSAYSQALYATVYEMDGDTGCYLSVDPNVKSDITNCERFYKTFATNLKVNKYCKNNSLKNGCIPMYKNYIVNPSCAGFSENMMNRYDQSFVMNDNSSITLFNMPSNVIRPIFAVDSNGKLMPNRSGYDLFSLVIIKNSKGNYSYHPYLTYCLPQEKGGIKNLQDVFK